MKKIILLILFIFPSLGFTDTTGGGYFKFGVGLDDKIGNTKILATGYQRHLFSFFDYQLEVGSFIDNNQTNGFIGFGGASIGTSVHTSSGFYSKIFAGPALISQIDTRLSSSFEFNDDFEFGLKDNRGVSLGINFKHISNAGLWPPNIGRDFMLIKVQFPF